jgi:hypothetical protein
MRKMMHTLLILGFSLFLCGIILMYFKDRTTLVPPPEQVSESFFKQIQLKRYSRAIPLLSSNLERKVTSYVLTELKREIEARIGAIEKVKGKEGIIKGDFASASAEVQGKEGSVDIPVKLLRQQGVWKVDSVMLNVH